MREKKHYLKGFFFFLSFLIYNKIRDYHMTPEGKKWDKEKLESW